MDSIATSLIIATGGAAWATLCVFGLRSDWYVRRVIESGLRSSRRPLTPELTAQALLWAKAVLVIGVVMGVVIAGLGVMTLVIGVMTALKGS